MSEHEVLTWSRYGEAACELGQEIRASGFHPDIVLAIAYDIECKSLFSMNVEFYTGGGTTLAAPVRSAVPYHKPRSVVQPDFVWRHTDRWIDFPWSSRG